MISEPPPDDHEDLLRMVEDLVGLNYRLWSADDRQDLVQDVVERYLQRWKGTERPDNREAWLNRVIRNRAVDVIRRRHPDQTAALADVEATLDGMRQFASGGPSQAAMMRQMVDVILEPLAPHVRTVFRRRYLDGDSSNQIAVDLGLTVNAVNKTAQRAREDLRKRFEAAPSLLDELRHAFPKLY